MPEITHRRGGELLQGVFRILRQAPDGMRKQDVLARLPSEVAPTDFESTEYPKRPGVRRYEKIVQFMTIGPVKAGWMLKAKGHWTLTDAGRKALEQYPDPERFTREAARLYRVWAAAQAEPPDGQDEAPVDLEVETTPAASAFEDAEGAAWDEINAHLASMDPYEFQRLVAGLLRGMSFHVAWVAPPGPDQGLDLVAYPDPLGVREPAIKVAVRRRAQKGDVKDVREFLAQLHGSDVGIFVALAGFTKPAEDLARAEQRKIRLLDLTRLFDLWVEHYAKVPEEHRRLLPLRPVWFLAPSEP
ncbi:MAG: Mrr restriction system protein [Deltaproteobacteria bacterium]|nr:Mrr restriction system protein [Deltaproteobacteria bacterium]